MWSANSEDVPRGKCYRLLHDGSAMSFRDLLTGLESDDSFARWYTALLADCPFLENQVSLSPDLLSPAFLDLYRGIREGTGQR